MDSMQDSLFSFLVKSFYLLHLSLRLNGVDKIASPHLVQLLSEFVFLICLF